LEKWLMREPAFYFVNTVDMIDVSWREKSFAEYDVVLHVAAIVHTRVNKATIYYQVNRDLAYETAKKAKDEGVRQFIFMSTMSVYGEEGSLSGGVVITRETVARPRTLYGKSKYEAENLIGALQDLNFNVSILRPPMVYGPGCPGNYAKLERLALLLPVFPLVDNQRSILHIDNLCRFLKECIDRNASGIFVPQDTAYMNTSLWVRDIARANGRKIFLSRCLGKVITIVCKRISVVKKIFGSLIRDRLYPARNFE
jgi:nucleoside-diphosphate-sugar epimerase